MFGNLDQSTLLVLASLAVLFGVPLAMLLWIAAQSIQMRALRRRMTRLEQAFTGVGEHADNRDWLEAADLPAPQGRAGEERDGKGLVTVQDAVGAGTVGSIAGSELHPTGAPPPASTETTNLDKGEQGASQLGTTSSQPGVEAQPVAGGLRTHAADVVTGAESDARRWLSEAVGETKHEQPVEGASDASTNAGDQDAAGAAAAGDATAGDLTASDPTSDSTREDDRGSDAETSA